MSQTVQSKTQPVSFWIVAALLCMVAMLFMQGSVVLFSAQASPTRFITIGIGAFGLVMAFLWGRFLLRTFAAPLTQLARNAQRIAEGDFSTSVRGVENNEIGQVQRALHDLVETLTRIKTDVGILKQAGVTGDLNTRVDASRYKGEAAQIAQDMNATLDIVSQPFHLAVDYMDKISKGDLPDRIIEEYQGDFKTMSQALNKLIDTMNEVTWVAVMLAGGTLDVDATERSEQDRLMKALNLMIKQLNLMTEEMERLIQAVQDGSLNTRIKIEAFTGSWRHLVVGINQVIDALVTPFTMVATCIDRIARGDVPAPITEEYKGDFNAIKQNVNLLIEAMESTTRLVEEIANGNLMVEAKERSEHDRLMKALNGMIQRLNEVLCELDGLIQSVQAGQLAVRGNADAFVGGWMKLIVGVNNLLDAFVTPINATAESLDRIARGDIPAPITTEYQGDFNTIKQNLNLLIASMEDTIRITEEIANGNLTAAVPKRSTQDRLMNALQSMVSGLNRILREMDELIHAVERGKLSARGDTTVFAGGWRDLIVGVNSLIEAFVTPIHRTAEDLDRLSRGEMPDKITEEYQGDFNVIKTSLNRLIDAIHDITRIAEEMARGNLIVTVQERSAHDNLMRALNVMITHVKDVATSVKIAVDQTTLSSSDMNDNADALSQGVAKQAASMEQVSSAMEQMAANIRQTADNAQQTDALARKAASYAEESSRVVAETVVAMQQIARKILIVRDIADQTRMLSLNATIEAARAQEAGKAFSVVAHEVRKLSDIAKTAAEEIDELANASVGIAENAGQMLASLMPDIHKTADLVQEMSAANKEQSMGAEHINTAVQQLDQVTQQNAMIAEQMASTAEGLAAQAKQLQQTIAFFKVSATAEESPTFNPKANAPASDQPEIATHAPEKRMNPSAGIALAIGRFEPGGDEQDGEFERY